jgi:hypothetical protein
MTSAVAGGEGVKSSKAASGFLEDVHIPQLLCQDMLR